MASTRPSDFHLLALAIKAALYDAQLEREGKTIVFFFDADVIAGALHARSTIEDESEQVMPFTRSVVKALWLQGLLPHARLTVPHLLELKRVLKRIQQEGGLRSYFNKNKLSISALSGLASRSTIRAGLNRLFEALADPDVANRKNRVSRVIDHLGVYEFALIEAELASSSFYDKQEIQKYIDLEGDIGEVQQTIVERDTRFKDVYSDLETLRPQKTVVNEADAASLLAIARLWERDFDSGIEYRFYTHTNIVRDYCESYPHGRKLMTRPRSELPADVRCTDRPECAVRSSTYLILRTAFPSVGFGLSKGVAVQVDELKLLADTADSLVQTSGEETDETHAHLRDAEIESRISLRNLISRLRDRKFTQQMLTARKERVLSSLETLGSDEPNLRKLWECLNGNIEEFNTQLVQAANTLTSKIMATVTRRNICSHLLRVITPDEKDLKVSIQRWAAVLTPLNAMNIAINGLKSICDPVGSRLPKLVSAALGRLGSSKSLTDAWADLVLLLTLGEYEVPIEFFRSCKRPETGSEICAYHAFKTWALSMAQDQDGNKMLESWLKFEKSLVNSKRLVRNSDGSPQDLDWFLLTVWVAVYVSSEIRDRIPASSPEADWHQIINTGTNCANAIIRQKWQNDDQYEMAWAGKLLLAANLAWFDEDAAALTVALDEPAQQTISNPSLYLMHARFWARFVVWHCRKQLHRIPSPNIDFAAMRNVAFEPFQLATENTIRKERLSSAPRKGDAAD